MYDAGDVMLLMGAAGVSHVCVECNDYTSILEAIVKERSDYLGQHLFRRSGYF